MTANSMSDVARLLQDKTSREGDCILWTGANTGVRGKSRQQPGYGLIGFGGRNRLAHRLAYELAHGSIPDHLVVMHTCDNPPCVNPEHLVLGSQRANSMDASAKGHLGSHRGELHYRAKLTDPEVAGVRDRAAAGEPLNVIALSVGLSTQAVNSIVSGRSRLDAGGPIRPLRKSRRESRSVVKIRRSLYEALHSAALVTGKRPAALIEELLDEAIRKAAAP